MKIYNGEKNKGEYLKNLFFTWKLNTSKKLNLFHLDAQNKRKIIK